MSTKHNQEDNLPNIRFKPGIARKPALIHPKTFLTLIQKLLKMVPQDRNIFLTMNEYEISSLNPKHKNSSESPSHILIFCIRLIRKEIFHPIGGLLIYKDKNQSAMIAECLKAYINDLSILGLHVMCTISPPAQIFKDVLAHLVKVNGFGIYYSGAISYSVAPFKQIIHLYDLNHLMIDFTNTFRQSVILKFMKGKYVYESCYDDILLTLQMTDALKSKSGHFSRNLNRDWSIFDKDFEKAFRECKEQGTLSGTHDVTERLLKNIKSLTAILGFDKIEVHHLESMGKTWKELQKCLSSMIFKKTKKSKLSKDKDTGVNYLKPRSSAIKKITFDERKSDFEDDSSIEIEENEMKDILQVIDDSFEEKGNNQKKNKGQVEGSSKSPHEKLKDCNQKRTISTTENIKINNLEKEISMLDGGDKENKNDTLRKGTSKITNILMDYFNSEDFKNQCDTENNYGCAETLELHKKQLMNSTTVFFDEFLESIHENYPKDMSNFVNNFFQTKYHEVEQGLKKVKNNDMDSIDAKDYINYLTCDTNQLNSDDEFCDADIFNEVGFEKKQLTNDWLSTINGVKKLGDLLQERRVKYFLPGALVIEHMDYFVSLIKKVKNKMLQETYVGKAYTFLDYECAFRTLQNDTGLYLIKK